MSVGDREDADSVSAITISPYGCPNKGQTSELTILFFYISDRKSSTCPVNNYLLQYKIFPEGLDFFYATESHANKMVDFISTVLPVRTVNSKKMISQDIHSNTYNCKFTYRSVQSNFSFYNYVDIRDCHGGGKFT